VDTEMSVGFRKRQRICWLGERLLGSLVEGFYYMEIVNYENRSLINVLIRTSHWNITWGTRMQSKTSHLISLTN
jgi:hypothetical protein